MNEPTRDSPEFGSSAPLIPFAADLELVRAARVDRGERLAELAVRCACLPRFVRALGARLGGHLQEHDVHDIAQTALLRAWEKFDSYAGEAGLESWLYGIARFEVLNALRRRHPRAADENRMDALADPSTDGDPGCARLDYEVLHAGMLDLHPEARSVVRLKHFENLTFEEIGRRLGVSPNTAKTRYYRGLTELRERLRSRFGPEGRP